MISTHSLTFLPLLSYIDNLYCRAGVVLSGATYQSADVSITKSALFFSGNYTQNLPDHPYPPRHSPFRFYNVRCLILQFYIAFRPIGGQIDSCALVSLFTVKRSAFVSRPLLFNIISGHGIKEWYHREWDQSEALCLPRRQGLFHPRRNRSL